MRKDPARVEPMTIDVDRAKWAAPRNRLPPRRHSEEKRELSAVPQSYPLLRLGVIKKSRATEWSQVHLVPKPTLVSGVLRSTLFSSTMLREVWKVGPFRTFSRRS